MLALTPPFVEKGTKVVNNFLQNRNVAPRRRSQPLAAARSPYPGRVSKVRKADPPRTRKLLSQRTLTTTTALPVPE